MADLSPITAKVVASASGMAGGLADAEKRLKESTSKMAAAAKADGDKAGKGFTSALATGLTFAAGTTLFAGLSRAFAELGSTISGGGGAARMLEIGTAARKAGADVAGFQVVVEALGNDLGTATEGLVKLKESIGKALVEGADDLVKPFERLNLDPVELLGMRDDKALALVAARLQELGGGVAEARAGVALFGDKFKDLRPILDDGGKWLGETAEQLKKFGAAFGEGDFLQSREWTRAINQLSLLWKGFQTQIAQGLMPLLNEVSKRFGTLADWGITFDGLKNKVLAVADVAVRGVLFVKEAFSDTSLITTAWDAVFNHIKAGVLDLVAAIQRSMAAVFKSSSWTKALGDQLGIEAANNSLSANLSRWAADNAKWALDLKLSTKASFKEWAQVMYNAQQAMAGGVAQPAKNALADLEKLWEQGSDRMAKALEGPVDKFKEAVQQVFALSRLRLAFVAGPERPGGEPLDDAQARTLGKAFQDLRSAFGSTYNPVAAMREGSAEAFSAIQANRYGRESVEEAIRRIMEQQLEQERQQANTGREVAKAVKALNAKLGVRGI